MPDKGRLLSPEGQQLATVYYTIYDDFVDSDGRRLVGEFTTETELDTTKPYIIRLQNAMRLDCAIGLCKAGPDGFGYHLYII